MSFLLMHILIVIDKTGFRSKTFLMSVLVPIIAWKYRTYKIKSRVFLTNVFSMIKLVLSLNHSVQLKNFDDKFFFNM